MTRVGVIGVGYFGGLHAKKFAAMPDVDLVAVADSDFSRAEDVGVVNNCMAFGGWSEMLKYGNLDAVSIATPTEYHYSIAWLMLQRGLDVFVEKPMVEKVEEAIHLTTMAKRENRILQVGHIERFNPVVRGLRHDHMKITRRSPYSERVKDIDVVMDLMIHDIDLALYMFGWDIDEICAHGRRVVSDHIDRAWATITFESGIVVNLHADRTLEKVVERSVQIGKDPAVDLNSHNGDPLMAELQSFVSSVKTRSAPVITGVDGREALRVVHQIRDLIAEG